MKMFLVMSNNAQKLDSKEVELVTTNESLACNYADEMDECCTAGRTYWVEEWEVEDRE